MQKSKDKHQEMLKEAARRIFDELDRERRCRNGRY